MALGYIIIIALGVYAALKFWKDSSASEVTKINKVGGVPGVTYYPAIAITNRPQQIAAGAPAVPEDSTQCGEFAPAFGPLENQPAMQHEPKKISLIFG